MMARPEPRKTWWTAEEIANACLPDMPATKRRVNSLADRCSWRSDPFHARRRTGRGGGWEYHWSLFPLAAQRKLLAEVAPNAMVLDRGTAWAAFEELTDSAKALARHRHAALQEVETLERSGLGRDLAVTEVARSRKVSARTVWNWLAMIDGVAPEDRLAYLAPRHRNAPRNVQRAECDPDFWSMLVSSYLRPAMPTFKACWRTAVTWAKANGRAHLTEKTARRKFDSEVPRVTQVFAREGAEGLERCFPPQIRDRSGLHALEAVNADCHKIDVFVEWPDGTINRPQIVAFQDIYSGKILSWRVDHDPNKVAVMAAFGEMIETYGIPKVCLFDNGREFANKWMTAGAKTRFRFKIKDDDPLGVLPLLGIQIHWARPGHGQAKPIERAFRDLASDVAKDVRFDGAYVGNSPMAKPADYGSRAIPAEDFLRVLEEGIREHNAREGRLSQTAKGRSFDETFAESYRVAPIRKATEEQRRLWLMGQEVRRLDRANGQLTLHKNLYHADWMVEHAGEEVIARFDAEDLHAGVWLYAKAGEFLGFAGCRQKVGFFDLLEAKTHHRRAAQIKRAEKRLLDVSRPMRPDEIGKRLDALTEDRPAPEALTAKVVAPEFGRTEVDPRLKRQATPAPASNAELEARRAAEIVAFEARKPEPSQPVEEPRDRFNRAQDIEARSEAGQRIGEAEAEWLRQYQTSAEYRALKRMIEIHGQDALG